MYHDIIAVRDISSQIKNIMFKLNKTTGMGGRTKQCCILSETVVLIYQVCKVPNILLSLDAGVYLFLKICKIGNQRDNSRKLLYNNFILCESSKQSDNNIMIDRCTILF